MLAFAAALLLGQAYPDRAKFLHALKALPDQAPAAEVIRVLGKPDRIEHYDTFDFELKKQFPAEIWLYGTDTPKGAGTLAEFSVYKGKLAYHPVTDDPPPASVISEADLRKGMHTVLDSWPDENHDSNEQIARWVAKTVNALLPLGEAKCKAIIGECGRVRESSHQLAPGMFFLTYALFDPPASPGYFDIFGPVWDAHPPVEDHALYPRWPIEVIGNVPIIRGHPMGAFGGFAPSFGTEFPKLRSRVHLRKSPLTVP